MNPQSNHFTPKPQYLKIEDYVTGRNESRFLITIELDYYEVNGRKTVVGLTSYMDNPDLVYELDLQVEKLIKKYIGHCYFDIMQTL